MLDGPKMLVAAVAVASLATFLPMGGAAAASEPLPAGPYTATIDSVGDLSFQVFTDGSVETVATPDEVDVYFKFDADIRVLDQFHVVAADGVYLVTVVVSEDGDYSVEVSDDPAWVPHTVARADKPAVDESDTDEPAESADETSTDEDESNGVAANKTDDQAPGQHGRDNADEHAGDSGSAGRANADANAGNGNASANAGNGNR